MARGAGRQAGNTGGGRSRGGRVMRALLLWIGLPLLFVVGVIAIIVGVEAQSLPSYEDLKSSQVGQTILVRARDGSELVSLGPSYGHWLTYEQIPEVMKQAIVSTEDRRFRDHIGIDPIGILRSLMVREQTGHWRQGGSTITQQLARTVFLNNNRTFNRKGREALIAMALEWRFSKDEILELYLNKVYFGGGAYGIDAASRKFFGHPATTLSLPEAAVIAGLVKAPSHFSPTADMQAARDRAKTVLSVMQDAGAITAEQAAEANVDKVTMVSEGKQNSVRYFTDWALPQLDTLVPDNKDPIEVWTTLDPKMQAAATGAIQANVPTGAQGALVSLDRDGAVLAMVGGTDYVTSNYNRATNAVRQPGSAWKLFVYLTALEGGAQPGDPVIDQPVTVDGWSPRNDEGRYAGQIDIRTAFAYSKNTVAAELGQKYGFDAIASMARRFGISTPIGTNPSMVLGTNDVRLIEMARAFAEVSARGTSVEPYGITKVETTDGRVLYQHQVLQGQTLVVPAVAAGITDLLQTAVSTGTGTAAQIGRPVAGKTGTTSSNKDGWFMGFSSGITTGVWMGRDDARPIRGLYGGTAPARAFSQYMRVAVASRPVEQFDTQVTLPAWQLEPDDMGNTGDPNGYYYPDGQGSPPAQGDGTGPGAPPPGDNGQQELDYGSPPEPARPAPRPAPTAPTAASRSFLDQATGRKTPPSGQPNI